MMSMISSGDHSAVSWNVNAFAVTLQSEDPDMYM